MTYAWYGAYFFLIHTHQHVANVNGTLSHKFTDRGAYRGMVHLRNFMLPFIPTCESSAVVWPPANTVDDDCRHRHLRRLQQRPKTGGGRWATSVWFNYEADVSLAWTSVSILCVSGWGRGLFFVFFSSFFVCSSRHNTKQASSFAQVVDGLAGWQT